MRIGIDARFYSEAGIGRYIRNLISELSKIDNENQYFIFLLNKNFDKVSLPKNFTKVRANFKWYGFSEQIKFPQLLGKYKLDLVHFPHFNIPIFYRGPFVVTIHDLIHQNFQMKRVTSHSPLIYKIKQKGYSKAFSTALKKSQKVITVSDYVKLELIDKWKVGSGKIVVTKEAAEEKFITLSRKISNAQAKKTLDKYNIHPPFIYYLGNAHPHKNVEGLINAFMILRKNYQYLTLVLSGHDHYFWERIKKENQQKDIIYTGYVTDEEAIAILKSAACYVQPSFEEGFGIPLLEAFAVGTPVASSDAASLPEVGGDAATYFDPKNPENMAKIIQNVLNNQKLRTDLIKKGQERYKLFSWEKMAKETLRIYKSVK
jgi:glycosyltransferase involved in cell wall biosynthesis